MDNITRKQAGLREGVVMIFQERCSIHHTLLCCAVIAENAETVHSVKWCIKGAHIVSKQAIELHEIK